MKGFYILPSCICYPEKCMCSKKVKYSFLIKSLLFHFPPRSILIDQYVLRCVFFGELGYTKEFYFLSNENVFFKCYIDQGVRKLKFSLYIRRHVIGTLRMRQNSAKMAINQFLPDSPGTKIVRISYEAIVTSPKKQLLGNHQPPLNALESGTSKYHNTRTAPK